MAKKRQKLISPTTTTTHVDDDKRPWSDFPCDLLVLMKKRLLYIDRVYFRAVCKSWNSIEKVAPLEQVPWLFVEDESNDNMEKSCTLVDSSSKTYTINGKALKDKFNIKKFKPSLVLHDSKFGWFLLSSIKKYPTTRVFFYSPFLSESKCFIELPTLRFRYGYDIIYATFTSNPLDDKENCTVLALHTNTKDNTIHIHMYGHGHNSWTSQVFKCEFMRVNDVERWMYSEGMFYYVTRKGTVGKFDFVRHAWNVFPSLPKPLFLPFEKDQSYHLVKEDGELFLILQCNLSRDVGETWCYDSHCIYKLDLSSMIWEDLKSIGDRALFVGFAYNKFLNASVLKLNGERKILSDKIYYSSYYKLRYCSAHDFILRTSANGSSRRLDCSRHYGRIVKKKSCLMLLIDPPPL